MVNIHRSKPNPAGRDKAGGYPIPSQLLGEWVDIINNGSGAVHLEGLHLANQRYDQNCSYQETRIYWSGSRAEVLAPRQVLRVHTGRRIDANQMHAQDWTGANLHSYADNGQFVLNNKCGDVLTLWTKSHTGAWVKHDTCSYSPYPPEGAVLVRSGDQLVVSQYAYT